MLDLAKSYERTADAMSPMSPRELLVDLKSRFNQ
jgi:hypothetical protein